MIEPSESIRELSDSIRALVQAGLTDSSNPSIRDFRVNCERPGSAYEHRPSINLFLYDLRKARERAHHEGTLIRCFYLVTAWAELGPLRTSNEHHALSVAIATLAQYPEIPASIENANGEITMILQGTLADKQPSPQADVLPPAGDHFPGIGSFWQAMGTVPKPKAIYAVTVPV